MKAAEDANMVVQVREVVAITATVEDLQKATVTIAISRVTATMDATLSVVAIMTSTTEVPIGSSATAYGSGSTVPTTTATTTVGGCASGPWIPEAHIGGTGISPA